MNLTWTLFVHLCLQMQWGQSRWGHLKHSSWNFCCFHDFLKEDAFLQPGWAKKTSVILMFTNIWNSTGRLSKMASASDISGLRMAMEGGHRALDGGQFRFLVKFESSVLCTLLAYIGHLGYFIPHLMNNKADFGFKVLKKLTSKTEKMRKYPKTANFGHVLVYLSNQICFAWILP